MHGDDIEAESEVSDTRTTIPEEIRRELGLDDGDRLRWQITSERSVRIHVVQQQVGTFADFEGYDGDTATETASRHDLWGVSDGDPK